MRNLAPLLLCAFLCSCVTQGASHNLDYAEFSSTLYIIGNNGEPVSPLGGEMMHLDDQVFPTSYAIRLKPGKRHVDYSCPVEKDAEVFLQDILPGGVFDFETGKEYELRCVKGSPVITVRQLQ